MHDHLRLADRQGLLCGRHLSEVQFQASHMLMYLADIQKYRDEVLAFKHAVAARPEFDVTKMFPEFFPAKVVDDESEAAPGEAVDYNYEAVEWKGPSDSDQETLNKMMALLKEATGNIDGATAVNHNGGGWT